MTRRHILGAMGLVTVTAWSMWAFAQRPPTPPGHPAPVTTIHAPSPAPAPTGAPTGEASEGAGKEGAKAEEDENAPPADINWVDFGRETPPYLALLINFGILAAGYYLLGKDGVAKGLKSRRDAIAKDIEEAQKMRKEAEKRAKVYQAKLEKLDDEMKTAREALVRAGEAERERLVTEAEAKAERMRKDAEFLVEQELKQVRVDLQREAVEAAIAAAEELLKKRVTQADQERIAEDYLRDLAGPRPSLAPPPPAGSPSVPPRGVS